MALRFIDSFDHYATADITKKWTTNLATQITSSGRFGSGMIGMSSVASITLDAQPTWIVGHAVFTAEFNTPMFAFADVLTYQIYTKINANGTISVIHGNGSTLATSTNVLSLSTWYYVEFKATINNTTGSYEVRVNGTSVGWIPEATGVDTQQTANATADVIAFDPSKGSIVIDDLYICDGTGGVNDDFQGDMRIEALFPDAEGDLLQWSPLGGGTHYTEVDETAPDADTSYVQDDTADQRDTYNFPQLSYTSGNVPGVQVLICAEKTDAGDKSICPVVRNASTNYDGTTATLGNSYSYVRQVYETDPSTSAAWTIQGVEDKEFGVKVVA